MYFLKILFLSIITAILLLTGCANNQVKSNKIAVKKPTKDKPKWLDDPFIDLPKNSIVAIGCARRHFKGKSAQQKLAISRAIDEIAAQVSTTVNNITLRKKTNFSSSASSTSLQETQNINVKTKVIDKYLNHTTGNLCVRVIRR
jgi:hypothetical protein